MLDFIAIPMGHILKFIYDNFAFGNYGAAIILFTIIIKGLLVPLYVKQYNSTSNLSEFQPKLQEIQKKYANDNEKLNVEMAKFYKENKINPAGGCLPILIQMPILFSLYYVISQPLKYMFGKSPETIDFLLKQIPVGADRIKNMPDMSIITYFSNHTDKLESVSYMLNKNELLNMNFFGINLGAVPSLNNFMLFINSKDLHNLVLFLIPLLVTITTYISVKYSSTQTSQTNNGNADASQKALQSSMNSMMLISPIMTGVFALSLPAGLSLYWIVGNIFQIFQQMYMNKFIIKKDLNTGKKGEKIRGNMNSD